MNVKKTYLISALNNHCPRCRTGYLFKSKNAYRLKGNTVMHENCPVCGQATEIEVGFYYGTGYISYALTVALSVATFVAWKVLIGLSFDIDDARIFYWLGANILLLFLVQPYIMRLARIFWLGFFVKYQKNWQQEIPKTPERLNKEQGANW